MGVIAGLDVGGAHLKVALVEDGTPVEVRQILCPLWQGMDKLDAALVEAAPLLRRATRFAVTMTGELSDLFEDRADGVARLIARLVAELGPAALYWAGRRGFADAEAARLLAADVGSTNFLATATLVAERARDGLLVDMGSTTTDIIAFRDGRPVVRGLTDGERLESSELVYTGLTRTAIMAVASRIPLRGRWQGMVREHYATMADVRRVLGELADGLDLHATADGRGKSVEESVARLARMLGRDAADGTPDEWRAVARFLADRQQEHIADGCRQVMSATAGSNGQAIVAAGIGADTVASLARRLCCGSITFGELTGATGGAAIAATHCAPAVAVALLAGA